MEESIDYGSADSQPSQPIPASQSPYPLPIQTNGGVSYPPQFQEPPGASFSQPNQAPMSTATPLQGYATQFESGAQMGDGVRAPLQGGTNLNVQQFSEPMMSPPYQPPNLVPQNAQTAAPPQSNKPGLFGSALKTLLSGGVNKNVPPAVRPWWIPANAYTNDAMVAPYHNMDIFWWDKQSMPDKPQWVRLAGDVTRYWNGYVQEPCFVFVEPFKQAPGNFVFHSRQFGGPRGWLQAVNQPDSKGFPLYRYWLDQPR